MMITLTLMMFSTTISVLMMVIASILSKKTEMDREKSSPFECGFDPKSSARTPFSLQFFLVAVIFLIFDVEITLLLPLTVINKMANPYNLSLSMFAFISILLVGLYHEWTQGALEWEC